MLLDAQLITEAQLAQALREQRETGGKVGQNLILAGAITRLDLYGCLAQQLGVPFVNLLTETPDEGILKSLDPATLVQAEWIPFRFDGETLTVATSIPFTDTMRREAKEAFEAQNLVLTVTTDWDLAQAVMRYCRDRLLFNAAEELATKSPGQSAKHGLKVWQKIAGIVFGASLIVGLGWATAVTIVVLLVLANIFFFIAVAFRTVTSIIGALQRHDDRVVARARAHARALGHDGRESGRESDAELPVYTILVPVFQEANMIAAFIDHLGTLDWPTAKLHVLVLFEESDVATFNACKDLSPPGYVHLLVVPDGTPQTKPRACNFGLMFAQGEYVVIFDAEDRPEPDQLRKAHTAFRDAQRRNSDVVEKTALQPHSRHSGSVRRLACVQASLNYFNSRQNVLTRMFTLEYSAWFDGMLRGMEVFRLAIPLGGTSNHFRADLLRQLGGWDPYNVTEDADLGMRAASAGLDITTIDSTTWEEACSEIPAWIRQRTRWIKGYMMTALVDSRYPLKFLRSAGVRGLISYVAVIASTPLLFLSYPVVWGFTILTYTGVRFTGLDLPPVFAQAALWNALVGNVAVIVITAWAGWRREGWRLAGYSIFNPVYWFLHAFAAWRALALLILRPFEWEKTPHGLANAPHEVATVT
jgi:cellulose synthase/poly-beta-1,6-N-acetylglucosamine synthase-like glycosyltransferase